MELALEALEARKAAIDAEIAHLGAELARTGSGRSAERIEPTTPIRRRRKRTLAQRKAQSVRMKAYWAKRRAKAAKSKTQIKK